MDELKLLKPLPEGRSYEQVRNHYLVEMEIAQRLKQASREERKAIYATMYDELFNKVPDHPRLTIRNDPHLTRIAVAGKMAVLLPFLNPETVFAEFAAGDCKLTFAVAGKVKKAYGVEISDQRDLHDTPPQNFQLIIYDGYTIDQIPPGSVDVIFSNNLIEHLHPEDTRDHFLLVHGLLVDGGRYIFRTPHAFLGPTDISQYFSEVPRGFHLKEWTYTELRRLLMGMGYSQIHVYWNAKTIHLRLPYGYFWLCERFLRILPRQLMRKLSYYLLPRIMCAAIR